MTATARKLKPESPKLKEREVLEWLTRHPTFFTKHADTLARMAASKKSGNILSLHAVRAEQVQKQASKLELTHQRLLQRATQNSMIADQIFATVLSLIGCKTLPELRRYLQTGLKNDLGVEASRLILAGKKTTTTLPTKTIQAMFADSTAALRHLPGPAEREMYGPKGKSMKSDCLLHLTHNGKTLGLLALASTDETHFHAGQSTTMAEFLAKVIAVCLSRFQ